MRSLCSFIFFLLGLSSTAQAFFKYQARLIPRGMDDQKQLLKGKVSIEEISATFTQATQCVTTSISSQGGKSVSINEAVTEVHTYAQELNISVQNLDDLQTMVVHQETLVEVFVSYISMINVISQSKSGVTECRKNLVEINTAFRSITSICLSKGINLHAEFNKHPKSSEYDPAEFNALNLDPPFADSDDQPVVDQSNPPVAGEATHDDHYTGEE